MPYVALDHDHLPGISGLLDTFKESALPLLQLAEHLLRGESPLTRGEREIIASSVSWWNGCLFCHNSHGAVAAAHLGRDLDLILDIRNDLRETDTSDKFRSLLQIARHVQQSGKAVTADLIEAARSAGATDRDIHDTVLIAGAFCMYNRYVDGLGTDAPEDLEMYRATGKRLAEQGYLKRDAR